jgi:hypothetical protein
MISLTFLKNFYHSSYSKIMNYYLFFVTSILTVSTTDIPILHSVEVTPFTQKSCYPFTTGLYGPHTPLLRKQAWPLQSSTSFRNPATVSKKGNIGVLRSKSHRSMIDPRTSLYAAPLLPLSLSGKVALH